MLFWHLFYSISLNQLKYNKCEIRQMLFATFISSQGYDQGYDKWRTSDGVAEGC